MKALSIWQPWASAIAIGSKKIETRHWSTNYRGLLAIHAAKHIDKDELFYWMTSANYQGALKININSQPLWETLPFGAVIAVCRLAGCVRVETLRSVDLNMKILPADGNTNHSWSEGELGNYEFGRFAWILDNLKPLKKPYPCKGQQGLFQVPDFIMKYV